MEIENINVGKEEGLSELEKEHLASERCKNFRVMTSRAAIKRLKASHDNEKQVRLPF